MASTVPAKTQPLHNFALPHLKWKNNHPRGRSSAAAASSPHHQSRSQSQSPSHSHSPMREPLGQSPMREPPRHSPLRGGDVVSEREGLPKTKTTVEHKRHPRNSSKTAVYTSDHDRVLDKSEKKSSSGPDQINNNINNSDTTITTSNNFKESRSRFLIKINAGARPRKSVSKGGEAGKQEEQKGEDEEEEEEPMGKTWNLRPRKPIRKSLNVNGGGALKGVGGSVVQENRAQSGQVNSNSGSSNRAEGGEASGGAAEKKEKRVRFSIPLSREEIEDDVFAITGSKPARRPKKRVKIVQKQLDTLFPGLWLASITPDSYKVSENPIKG